MKEYNIKKNILVFLKKGIERILCINANTVGCYIINQPKTPEGLDKFKKFKD